MGGRLAVASILALVLLHGCAARPQSACDLSSTELAALKARVAVFLEAKLGAKRAQCEAISDITMAVRGGCSVYVAPRAGDDCPQVYGGDYWVQFRSDAGEPLDVAVVAR